MFWFNIATRQFKIYLWLYYVFLLTSILGIKSFIVSGPCPTPYLLLLKKYSLATMSVHCLLNCHFPLPHFYFLLSVSFFLTSLFVLCLLWDPGYGLISSSRFHHSRLYCIPNWINYSSTWYYLVLPYFNMKNFV